MTKYSRTNLTVDAVKLSFPTTLTTPTGVIRGNKGDYLVSLGHDNQFIVNEEVFELTYAPQMDPDTVAPLEISNLVVADLTDTTVKFSFKTPYDADFNSVKVFIDGVVVTELAGGEQEYEAINLTALTQYTFLFVATDKTGNESTGVTRVVTTLDTPPVVTP